MRRALLTALAVLVMGSVVALPALAATTSIKVGDNYFIKKGGGSLAVKKGTTVKWVFSGKAKHTVTGTGAGSFIDSGAPKKSGAYSLKITRKGTFKIICSIHGKAQRMTLKVN